MPEIAAAHRAAQRAGEAPARGLDQVFAGGVALVAVVGLLAYPYANADETRQAARKGERSATRTAVAVAVPTLATVRESAVSASSIAEALPGPEAQRDVAPKVAPVTRVAETGQRASRPTPALAVPVTSAMPARDAAATGDAQSMDPPSPPPAAAPPAPVDPWQTLRDALGACARSGGVWERATCEQRARLAHCDGYWGSIALCPSGRTEFGQ